MQLPHFKTTPDKDTGSPRTDGFALITALMLMGFILLILVTLISVTQIEAQQSIQTAQVKIARQNALLALNVAVGELQKYAGPDQRTTATANLNENWTGSTTANGNWIGVYGNAASADYTAPPSSLAQTITTHSNSRGSQARLLNWLVSGNETIPNMEVAADGHIESPPASFNFEPNSAIDLDRISTAPSSTDTQVALVGPNTVNRASDHVAAPLVEFDPNASTSGRYAWWIGDENAKANVTMGMPSGTQLPAAFVTAQRAAIELVDQENLNAFDPTQLIGNNFDPTYSASPKINWLGDLAFTAAQSESDMKTAVRTNFHHLTPHSESLPVDSYAGGLKQDLSALLATDATTPLNDEYLFTPEGGSGDEFGVPTWGMLRSFAQTTAPATGLTPRLPTETQTGISPVLTYFALGLEYVAPQGAADGAPIRLAMYPVVVLWNPYTTPIAAAQYEVGYTNRTYARIQLQMNDSLDPTDPNWVAKETIDFSKGASSGTYRSYVRFLIDSPTIQPGESLIFSLPDSESGKEYSAPQNDVPTNVLTNDEGYKAYNFILLNRNGLDFGPGESAYDFRVSNYEFIGEDPSTRRVNMQRGESDLYLGVVDQGRSDYTTDSSNDQQWYQSINRITQGSGGAEVHLLQDEGPLDYPVGPTSVISFNKIFSDVSESPNTYVETRWIAQNNPRAPLVTRSELDGQPLNYFGRCNKGISLDQFTMESGLKRASSGISLDSASEIIDTTLFEIRPESQPLLALGQLQHANLSKLNTYPAYPIGNGVGDFHFKDQLGQVYQSMAESLNSYYRPTNSIVAYYDISWLLNRSLWDRYFVSTVPHAGTGSNSDTSSTTIPNELPNSRILRSDTISDSDLRDASLAASGLSVNGGFNINSTSEQAWRAILGGINQLAYNPETGSASGTELQSPLPRFSRPTSASGNQSWAWQGYKQLTDEQIAELAKNIVAESRNRGPFVSLADFINRRLVDNPSTATDERFTGVLQAALDRTYTGSAAINAGETNSYAARGSNPFYDSQPNAPTGGSGFNNYDLDLLKGYSGPSEETRAYGSKSAFSPQFLTQGDILSAIGSGLSARSDTFVIRTYGEVMDPLTRKSGGRIWCEAIVQRKIDYIDESANTSDDTASSLNAENLAFGRKFKILSLRWLRPEQI
ncbi:hypothetical protein [Puniceicoccus vermicola]|uniref:Verru_Chthon cassette protein A n=1 Tax=Puniceicoccus vermicola TaxID=388746 RepID=A0A7X1B1A9_9BACT|nr:hypothetical protein [Puniceicoccus vermicola]MBC2603722.1 hypothetical protein [Puniceicoccus vermicola]